MKTFNEFVNQSLEEQVNKQYWFVYRVSDHLIIDGGFDREEEANDVLADIDDDKYDVGLGVRQGGKVKLMK